MIKEKYRKMLEDAREAEGKMSSSSDEFEEICHEGFINDLSHSIMGRKRLV